MAQTVAGHFLIPAASRAATAKSRFDHSDSGMTGRRYAWTRVAATRAGCRKIGTSRRPAVFGRFGRDRNQPFFEIDGVPDEAVNLGGAQTGKAADCREPGEGARRPALSSRSNCAGVRMPGSLAKTLAFPSASPDSRGQTHGHRRN